MSHRVLFMVLFNCLVSVHLHLRSADYQERFVARCGDNDRRTHTALGQCLANQQRYVEPLLVASWAPVGGSGTPAVVLGLDPPDAEGHVDVAAPALNTECGAVDL